MAGRSVRLFYTDFALRRLAPADSRLHQRRQHLKAM